MTDPSHAHPAASALDDEALDWFVRHGGGPQAQADAAFQRWLAADPAHPVAYARWQAEWRQLDALPAEGVQQLRRQLQDDQDSAAATAATSSRGRWRGFSLRAPQAALAAAVLALAGGSSHVAWNQWQQQPLFAQSFETQRGQQQDVQLPDGSALHLDTATQVEVRLYRQRREVRLAEGQAVFEVQGDASRPFDVLAGDTRVTVVGTRFSVRHVAGSPVRVSVEQGRVRVAPSALAADAPALLLGAGQQYADGTVGRLAASGMAPWRDGRITLDNLPLSQALAEFERYGPTRMVVRDPAVAQLRVSGTFDPLQLDNFRRALPRVLPVQLRESAGVAEIVASP